MKRVHAMPFGCEIGEGATRFRLWAPAARRVDLVVEAGSNFHDIALGRDAGGWFHASVEGIADGARYAFRIDDALTVPDPASRSNPDGVHAPSRVVDALAFDWADGDWHGRPWEQAVLYELHAGAFTPEGTFASAIDRLDDLAALGVTAVELMPVAAFPGKRNWGYDGVLPFAPAACYGAPEDLKRLVQAAHARQLMMLLDVVYNHFGPEGNYLHAYAPAFFNPRHRTPWGDAINFDADGSRVVRDFFLHNALYWLEEFHFDGLRLDAVHAIVDDSRPDFVTELTTTVRARFAGERHVHVVIENDRNEAGRLVRDAAGAPLRATAQWNDDIHHAAHVLVTGERDGYYADYAARPLWSFGRALAEGFVQQGERSPFRGHTRGDPSGALPATAFVSFLQTHDQVGNRALGERLVTLAHADALRAATACVLLAPAPPMLFMGEEFAATTPFLFFCDFGAELAAAVTRGRRAEFARFDRFGDPAAIPDPNHVATFERSKLDWRERDAEPGERWLAFCRHCLSLRQRHVVPRLAKLTPGGRFRVDRDTLLTVDWGFDDGSALHLLANFAAEPMSGVALPPGEMFYGERAADGTMAAWGVAFVLED